MVNKKVKVSIMCMILIGVTGCSKPRDNNGYIKSSAQINGSRVTYNNMKTLDNEIELGLVPNTEEGIFRLESIENGVAFLAQLEEDGTIAKRQFYIAPSLQKQIDDAGVYYEKDNTLWLNFEEMSELNIKFLRDVAVNDINEAEEYADFLETMLIVPGSYLGTFNVVTSITSIKKSEVPPRTPVKTYETDEDIDNGIINGDFDRTGSNFFMGGYKILNQNTILGTKRNNGNVKKVFKITPSIVQQLKTSEDESFIVWYEEFNGEDYIIRLDKY